MRGNMAGQNPQVFTLDGRRQAGPMHPHMYPAMMDPSRVPCWTFPPAREERRQRAGGCCTGSSLVSILVMVLALVFAALGLGAYQIHKLQTRLTELTQDMDGHSSHSSAPQRQTSIPDDAEFNHPERLAAHLTVNTKREVQQETLKWFPNHGRAFTKGVRYIDGSLQVNHTGLYFIYSRIEILGNRCSEKKSFLHKVLVKRDREPALTLMEGHKEASCKGRDGWTTGHVWTDNSYLGAVLELKQQDLVSVSVSQPELVNIDSPYGNYFGLYEIA